MNFHVFNDKGLHETVEWTQGIREQEMFNVKKTQGPHFFNKIWNQQLPRPLRMSYEQ